MTLLWFFLFIAASVIVVFMFYIHCKLAKRIEELEKEVRGYSKRLSEADEEIVSLRQELGRLRRRRQLYIDARNDDSDVLNRRIKSCGLNVRVYNCLKAHNVDTLSDLVRITPETLKSFRLLGRKSLEEICLMLGSKGLHLGMTEEEIKEFNRRAGTK